MNLSPINSVKLSSICFRYLLFSTSYKKKVIDKFFSLGFNIFIVSNVYFSISGMVSKYFFAVSLIFISSGITLDDLYFLGNSFTNGNFLFINKMES